MENSVSKAIEKAQQFSGYLELKEYQRKKKSSEKSRGISENLVV
jgi:hypothetical protein